MIVFPANIYGLVGIYMNYEIIEGNNFSVNCYGVLVKIEVCDLYFLIDNSLEEFIKKLFEKDKFLSIFNFSEDINNLLLKYIINDRENNELIEELNKIDLPLYSTIIAFVNSYKRKYKYLKMMNIANTITFKCNNNNILKALSIAACFKSDIIIDSLNISLEDYRLLLASFDFDSIENLNIKVNYQENNSYITPRELYEVSSIIYETSTDIKKYNLSPFEQIMSVYDIVKNREYKECEENKRNSRDLDKVLQGDDIVCVGYSNLFNAVLKCLNINAIPLIDFKVKHQRSLVYVNDPKYHINGVYSFDPTGDRKLSDEDTDFMENYRYFANITNIQDSNVFGEILEVLQMDLEDIIKVINSYDNSSDYYKIMDNLERLFKLVNSDKFSEFVYDVSFYDFVDTETKSRIINTYEDLLSKFNVNNIRRETFVLALYNTRRIEYYNWLINDFSIDSIVDATVKRYTFIESLSLKKKENNPLKLRMKLLLYQIEMIESLNNRMICKLIAKNNKVSPSRDEENIRLLKVLRKIKQY